mmetsp:Transcript_97908/g.255412  ORF Transcript_97908/g.255412 Transcript_97908/m.255412 type:complete len:208 (+) Transcript_97908:1491-2114(+)
MGSASSNSSVAVAFPAQATTKFSPMSTPKAASQPPNPCWPASKSRFSPSSTPRKTDAMEPTCEPRYSKSSGISASASHQPWMCLAISGSNRWWNCEAHQWAAAALPRRPPKSAYMLAGVSRNPKGKRSASRAVFGISAITTARSSFRSASADRPAEGAAPAPAVASCAARITDAAAARNSMGASALSWGAGQTTSLPSSPWTMYLPR